MAGPAGVTLCLPGPMKDPKAGLNLKKGCQTLNGGQALSFVRTREFPLGDLQREQDQRALLQSLLSKMTSTGTLINPFAVIPRPTVPRPPSRSTRAPACRSSPRWHSP